MSASKRNLSATLSGLARTISLSQALILASLTGFMFFQVLNVQQLNGEQLTDSRNLTNLNRQLSLVNTTLRRWLLDQDNSTAQQLGNHWQDIWRMVEALSSIKNAAVQESLQEAVTRLELSHWRVYDYHRQRLSKIGAQLDGDHQRPLAEEVFAATTRMIERTDNRETGLLKTAANLRAFATKSYATHLNFRKSNDDVDWQAFLESESIMINAADDAIRGFPSNQDLPYIKDLIGAFSDNAHTLRKIDLSLVYFDNDRALRDIGVKTDTLLLVLNQLDNALQQRQEEREQSLLATLAFGIGILVIAALLLFISLRAWSHRLNRDLNEPINAVIAQADVIADGGGEAVTIPHQIAELGSLVDAMERIRFLVHRKQQQVNQQLDFEQSLNRLADIANHSTTIREFCQAVVDHLSEENEAEALAFYANARGSARESFRLLGGFNLPADLASHYEKHFDGLPAEVWRTGKAIQRSHEGLLSARSGTLEVPINHRLMLPLANQEGVVGVLEFASWEAPPDTQHFQALAEKVAILFTSVASRVQTEALLLETESQRSRLDKALGSLKLHTSALKASEQTLEQKADELKETNDRLLSQQKETENQKRELELLNQELTQAAKELAYASEQKSNFLSKVSHELKTPLNSIMILTQTLLRDADNLSVDQRGSLEVINYSGKDLASLISDLLDLARLEAGELRILKEHVPVEFLFERLKKQFEPIAARNSLGWQVNLPETEVVVYTDIQRLSQILRNFLSNAFKFTSEGGVTLTAKTQENELLLSVTDTGIGIRNEDQELIFESFKQLDEGTKRAYNGTGLGLNICTQLAGFLGGNIAVESTQGEGSKFTLSLPLKDETVGSPPLISDHANRSKASIAEFLVIAPPDSSFPADLRSKSITNNFDLLTLGQLTSIEPEGYATAILHLPFGEWLFAEDNGVKEAVAHLQEKTDLIVVSDRRLPAALDWLERECNTLLLWNTAGQERLRMVLENRRQTVPAILDQSDAAPISQLSLVPTAPTIPETIDSSEPDSAHHALKEQQVLLVGEDMKQLFSLSIGLKQCGARTSLADSTDLAIHKLGKENVDILIFDVDHPDTVKLLDWVTNQPALTSLPRFALSRNLNEKSRAASQADGYLSIFSFSMDTKQLLTAIETDVSTSLMTEAK